MLSMKTRVVMTVRKTLGYATSTRCGFARDTLHCRRSEQRTETIGQFAEPVLWKSRSPMAWFHTVTASHSSSMLGRTMAFSTRHMRVSDHVR